MDDKKAARTNFRVLFLKKMDRNGVVRSLGNLSKVILKITVLGHLERAGNPAELGEASGMLPEPLFRS